MFHSHSTNRPLLANQTNPNNPLTFFQTLPEHSFPIRHGDPVVSCQTSLLTITPATVQQWCSDLRAVQARPLWGWNQNIWPNNRQNSSSVVLLRWCCTGLLVGIHTHTHNYFDDLLVGLGVGVVEEYLTANKHVFHLQRMARSGLSVTTVKDPLCSRAAGTLWLHLRHYPH